MKTNWIVAIKNAIADLITRTKGLDDTHDDLGTHETSQAIHRTALGTHDTAIKALAAKQLFTMDFWSLPQEEVALTGTAGDKTLPSVTIADLPDGATIVRAIAMFKFRMVENHTFAGTNALEGAQEIQVKEHDSGSYVDAINFLDAMFGLAQDTREGGDVIIGAIDISGSGKVEANAVYDFLWDEAEAEETGINFNDVQCGLRIWYSV